MQNYVDPAIIEARAILRLVMLGNETIDGARELIGVPGREASALSAFVAISGKAGAPIQYALKFRQRVLEQFEELVQANHLEDVSSDVDSAENESKILLN
jgi:hypothetical protein